MIIGRYHLWEAVNVEKTGRRFLQNISTCLPTYTASRYRRRYVLSQTGDGVLYLYMDKTRCQIIFIWGLLSSGLVVAYRRFGTTCPSSDCPATSVTDYEPTLLNTPKERRPELDCTGSPKFYVYGLIVRFLDLANVDYRTEVCFACSKSELACVCFADFQRIRLNIANGVCQSAVQYKFTKQYAN